MGLCQYVDLCFHASSLPCLHTCWHAIPTSFYIFNVFYLLFTSITAPQDAHKRLVLQVYLGSKTLELSAICSEKLC